MYQFDKAVYVQLDEIFELVNVLAILGCLLPFRTRIFDYTKITSNEDSIPSHSFHNVRDFYYTLP